MPRGGDVPKVGPSSSARRGCRLRTVFSHREQPKAISKALQERSSPTPTDQAIKLPLPPQRLHHSLINTCERRQNSSCMSVTDRLQRDLSSSEGNSCKGPGQGTAVVGEGRQQRVSGTKRSQRPVLGTQHSNEYQKMAKKRSIPFCNVVKDLGFFSDKANLLCFVHGRRAMINSTVQNSRALKFSPQWQHIHNNPSS